MIYLLLWTAAALVDKGIAMYAARREGLSYEVDNLITHLIMIFDDNLSVSAATLVTYGK